MRAATRRGLAALVLPPLVAAALMGCRSGAKAAEGRLEAGGQVLLTERGGKPVTTTRARDLSSGDTVEVFEGTARITLPGGQALELQPRSLLVLDQGPDLRSGDLLVTSPPTGGTSRPVRAAGSEVGVAGAARIAFAPALRVVTYQGTSSVRSAGRQLDVPALRAADVSLPGLLPGRPSPLVLDRGDPWAGRFLGEALDAEDGLESRARGFTSQVSAQDARATAFYVGLLPRLATEAALGQELIDRFGRAQVDGPVRAGEVLIGSAVALQGRRGTFAERVAGAAAFRAEGASWALVAVDQQVPSIDTLVRDVDAAINVAPLELAAPPPPSPTPPPSAPPRTTPSTQPATPRGRPSTPTTTPTRPGGQAPAAPPTPAPPTGPPPAVPLDPLLDATLDPIVALLADLLDGR